jgi:uncharacterized protein YbgA (DUF1722 family)/uncharacterized protein YbbK (DUF523 family)
MSRGKPPAARERARPRLGISACLLGQEVRYDGGHKRDAFLTETLARFVEWVPVCPEVEAGLGIPRESIRLEGDPDAPRLVGTRTRTDHTGAMGRYARARTEQIARLDLAGYVLKKDSPSCGLERVRVYGPSGTAVRRSSGVFARALMDRLPLLPLEDEGRLHDPVLRENFVERVFAYERWKRFLADRPTRGGLVAFHTAHKLLLLAHDPAAYRRLGRLVADAKARRLSEVVHDYGAGMMRALRRAATAPRHVNVLEHMLGYVSDDLPAAERHEMVGVIADYRCGVVPLIVPLTLMKHHVRRLGVEYLAGQVYLDPHPKELMLRNHV